MFPRSTIALALGLVLGSFCVSCDAVDTGPLPPAGELAPGTTLSAQAQALVGCWEGFQGDEHVEYRFSVDGHTVVSRDLDEGDEYVGRYAINGERLTLDFGEEPPTVYIELTTTTMTWTQFPFSFERVACTAD